MRIIKSLSFIILLNNFGIGWKSLIVRTTIPILAINIVIRITRPENPMKK